MNTTTSISRRRLLAGIAAAGVGSAGLALSYRAHDQGLLPTTRASAFGTWDEWAKGSPAEQMVKAAILSANPHNSQPWRFRIGEDAVDVFADLSRSTGANDPFHRELFVGLGCAIENMVITGEALGLASSVTFMPASGERDHVARIAVSQTTPAPSELYAAIPRRHSNRGAYSSRQLSDSHLTQAARLGQTDLPDVGLTWFAGDERKQVGDGIVAATEAFIADEGQSVDSFLWYRSDWDEIQRHKDGLSIDGAGLSPLVTALGKLLPAQSRHDNDRSWLKQARDVQVKTAAAFGVVSVPDAMSRVMQMRGGRLLQRVHLWATASGLALQHMNQMTERADREGQLGLVPEFANLLRGLLPGERGEVLAAVRIGYPERQGKRSPRRPLTEVLDGREATDLESHS